MEGASKASLAERVLLGTAVGDAYGLGAEGLPRRVTEKIIDWKPPFLGRCILSDDTEQSFLVTQALLRHPEDATKFRRALRWRLIGWLVALPPGVGLGTVRSIVKLIFGGTNGVRTAGNGAAMRAPIIGAAFATQPEHLEEFVSASTTLTHADPRALVGALAVAYAAGAGQRGESWRDVFEHVETTAMSAPDSDRWTAAKRTFEESLANGESVAQYADAIGCGKGISGYVYDTVPVALYAWASSVDPLATLTEVWRCGGDTDTVGAIAGALLYAKFDSPPERALLANIRDFPITISALQTAARRLANGGGPVGWSWFVMPLRNLVFFPLILFYALFVLMPRKYLG